MLKYILSFMIIGVSIGGIMAYNSSYTPISKQIDLKTMSLKKPDYLIYSYSICKGSCKNYSSSSSYGGGSYGGK
ncbi:MAG: hypothetical protein Q9M94_07130 [Candidatus Gracilibacteria bacterium]|nr:hypothetical protein [Candidatus Gracilibacteria bacterium]